MIKTIEMHKVICDRCGADAFADAEYSCFHGEAEAREQADADDWRTFGEKDYCPNCLIYDDETDEYIPNPEPFVPEIKET